MCPQPGDGRISENCIPVRRGASGFGVPPLGGAFWAAASLASRLKAELQTRFLEAQPVLQLSEMCPQPGDQDLFPIGDGRVQIIRAAALRICIIV